MLVCPPNKHKQAMDEVKAQARKVFSLIETFMNDFKVNELQTLSHYFSDCKVSLNERVYEEDEPANKFYLVGHGQISLLKIINDGVIY